MRVALEWDVRELARHPHIEGIVQEQVAMIGEMIPPWGARISTPNYVKLIWWCPMQDRISARGLVFPLHQSASKLKKNRQILPVPATKYQPLSSANLRQLQK
jgi:hypothetical protein